MDSANRDSVSRAALLVAHPGHEVALYGWLRREKPTVFVLTRGKKGVDATRRLVREVGAREGSVFGECDEAQLYDALLAGDSEFFVRLAKTLIDETAQCDMVVGDALEGISAAHDVWRCVTDAVVLRRARDGHNLQNFEYTLFGDPGACPPELKERAIRLALDAEEHACKLAAARADTANRREVRALLEGDASIMLRDFPDLAARLGLRLAGLNPNSFRVECLRPTTPFATVSGVRAPPFWELYGERLVERGAYAHVLRWQEHVEPIARVLEAWATSTDERN